MGSEMCIRDSVKHAPAKTDNPLRAGVFLGYYLAPGGKFTGQYIVSDLEDFAGKNLHRHIGRGHFHISIHRTEVVRNPIGTRAPVFPLMKKYWRANYTLGGVEDKVSPDEIPVPDHSGDRPDADDAVFSGKAEIHNPETRVLSDGRTIKVGGDGTWLRKHKNWRPEEVPIEYWRKIPSMHQYWREIFPDPRRMPDLETDVTPEDPSSSGGPTSGPDTVDGSDNPAGDGIEEGDIGPSAPDIAKVSRNYWQETPPHYIFWKVRPSKGVVFPNGKRDNNPTLESVSYTHLTLPTKA